MHRRLFLHLVVLSMGLAATAGGAGDWPCFHGPKRDNKSPETGLLKAWPEGGPKRLWTASGIGHGYSAVSVTADRIFTAGMIEKETHVFALDLSGTIVWRRPNGKSWQAGERQRWAMGHAGSRGTPTVDGDTVYHLGEMGRLAAFDARTGDERWHLDLLETFKAPRPKYGFSESVLIQGNRLFCCPGGTEGYIVALDKRTGRTLWTNAEIKDPIGYSSPVLCTVDGVEQLISLSAARVFAVRPDNGKLLWDYEFANSRKNNVTDIVVKDGLVHAASPYGKGSVLLRPRRKADGRFAVESVWTNKLLDNHHGGVILLDGHLYGAGHQSRGWTCLEFRSGRKLWQSPGKGSLTYADRMLYCLDERGTLSLVRPTPEKWDAVSSFKVPSGGKGLHWAHPVISRGRLYVRHSGKLYAYQVGKDD